MVGRTGSGARVVPPKDSSSAMRFVLADVDDSGAGVNVSRKFEPSVVESEVAGATVVLVAVVVVVVVDEVTFADSIDKIFGENWCSI